MFASNDFCIKLYVIHSSTQGFKAKTVVCFQPEATLQFLTLISY